MTKFQRYLAKEIGIEFKACLYFFVILFFYSMYRIIGGSWQADIIMLAEMILTTYAMGYIQVFLLRNFDEGERFGLFEAMAAVFCTTVYTGVAFLGKWFDKNITAYIIFFAYLLFAYVCAMLVYKIKREVDTSILNEELENFKKKKKEKNL